MPSSTVTNGIGGAWEYRRGGYSLVLNGAWFARATWQAWGLPGAPDGRATCAGATYIKYSGSLSRDFYFNVVSQDPSERRLVRRPATSIGSPSISSGMFDDTRIHGVPAPASGSSELAMARGSYSFNIFEQYRLDLFLEQAWGRDRAVDAATGSRSPGSASRSTSARRGIRSCVPTSARASCRRATATSARPRCRSCS